MHNQIKFSHNWNNKLSNNIFTTIRGYNQQKYIYYRDKTNESFHIILKNKKVGEAFLRKVSKEVLGKIRPIILRLDKGYFNDEKILSIFQDFGVQQHDEVILLTLEKCSSHQEEVKEK